MALFTDQVTSAIFSISPATWVQSIFLLTSSAALALTVLPAAERQLLLSYGPRRGQVNNTTSPASDGRESLAEQQNVDDTRRSTALESVRQLTAYGQVPHAWFVTYYAFYISCASFWALQYFYLQDAPFNLLRYLSRWQDEVTAAREDAPQMTGAQVVLAWCLMLVQALRRLYECFAVMKPSKSTMWFLHWFMGLGFYLGLSVAIWIEGSAAITQNQIRFTDQERSLTAGATTKAAVALPLFSWGWIMQYRCHEQLAALKKYSLPDRGMFRYLVCPHYTCECMIYLSLAIIAAPEGQWWNKTLVSVLMFVAVNLGVTAHGTKNWYMAKFERDRVVRKWNMIPFLY